MKKLSDVLQLSAATALFVIAVIGVSMAASDIVVANTWAQRILSIAVGWLLSSLTLVAVLWWIAKITEVRQPQPMATFKPREELLERLVIHLSLCTNCQDTLHFGFGGPLCVNGERLWMAAQMPKLPDEMPPGWGPADLPNTQTTWKPGPLVPKNETH